MQRTGYVLGARSDISRRERTRSEAGPPPAKLTIPQTQDSKLEMGPSRRHAAYFSLSRDGPWNSRPWLGAAGACQTADGFACVLLRSLSVCPAAARTLGSAPSHPAIIRNYRIIPIDKNPVFVQEPNNRNVRVGLSQPCSCQDRVACRRCAAQSAMTHRHLVDGGGHNQLL